MLLMMKRWMIFGVALLALSGVLACERQEGAGTSGQEGRRSAGALLMPRFTLPQVVDRPAVNSDDLAGKVVLATFFATWCPPCLQEIPALIRLQEEYGASGFSVLGLSVDQAGPEVVAQLVRDKGITYPVVMADEEVASGFGGFSGIPTSFLVDRQGRIVQRYIGYTEREVLAGDVIALLEKGQ